MTTLPLRGYAGAPGAQLHYRTLGEGPPVILFHSSPLSSAFMLGQLQALAEAGHRAIALDTPGYGQSDPLPAPPQSLTDYARAFLAGIDAMGIDRFGLYGTATGAQLALALARFAPHRLTRLVLDNCALFTEDQVADWEPRYFPDSIVRREMQALVAEGLPSCVRVVTAGASPAERFAAMVKGFAEG
ncbi:MAG: alpha/beta fold hydrolase [Gammaproteobacteria bacterium]|nr:alpha/beta fold hydrolase [Gammaproteobacteria bacterium]